ncbi:Phytosulfokine receptor 1 [Glycine soja]
MLPVKELFERFKSYIIRYFKSIPLIKNKYLNELYLEDNMLSGPLSEGLNLTSPTMSFLEFYLISFGASQGLSFSLSESNRFTGQLPASLVNSPSLQILNLRNNSLGGSVNFNGSVMKNLTCIVLSHNHFPCSVLVSLMNCLRFEAIGLGSNHFNCGEIPINFKNLRSLTQLSLPNTNLHNLSATLEKCHNQRVRLSGPIPWQLSGMAMMEILDLSHNKLFGEIPQSLTELSFLSSFDVSYNELHREIPEKGQFDTFPLTSFEGNRGLYRCSASGFMPSPPDETPAQPHHQKLQIIDFPFWFGSLAGILITIGILFLSTILIAFISFGSTTQNFTSSPNDLKALIGFSRCLESAIPDWNSSTSSDYCTWSGVTCVGTRVVRLELGSTQLTGKICESLACLDQLRVLKLSKNLFTGSLPHSLFHLPNLEIMDFSNNQFEGSIDTTMCSSFTQLRDNKLSRPLSEGVGKLSNLLEFDISNNEFSGILPNIFGGLTRLKVFYAGSNRFTGPLPASLVNSVSLQMLNLKINSLAGSVNFNCSALKNIVLINNQSNCSEYVLVLLTISTTERPPVNFKNLRSLTQLTSEGRPAHCKNLSTLVLTNNFHNEEMPQAQGQNLEFSNLKVFVLANSQIKGSIPKWLSGCKMLQMLDLSWNHLSGGIPPWIGKLNNLYYLDLSNNSFTGRIPQSFTMFLSLQPNNSSLEGTLFAFPFDTVETGTLKRMKYEKLSNLRPSLLLMVSTIKSKVS